MKGRRWHPTSKLVSPSPTPNLGVAPRSTQGGPYSIQQRITVEGLVEERDRAGLQGSPARLLVAVRSQDDNTNGGVSDRQVPQEVEAAHPGHPQIEHQATGVLSLGGSQELLRGGERLHSEAHRPQEIPERPTQ